jgi:hypothetical protein
LQIAATDELRRYAPGERKRISGDLTLLLIPIEGLALNLTHTRGHRNSSEGDNTHKDLPATNAAEHELLYLGFY